MPERPTDRDDFHYAIICALPVEYDAVHGSFDETWPDGDYGKASGDPNLYAVGLMGELPVVLLILPGSGKSGAASAAASLRSSYKNLSLALLVGVCGAIPYLPDDTEVFLGDVIISKYLVQYDLGRQYQDEFKPKRTIEDALGRPNKETRILCAFLETSSGRDRLEEEAQSLLRQLQDKTNDTKHRRKYDYVGMSHDRLFEPDHRHKHYNAKQCDICDACQSNANPVRESSFEMNCAELGCSDNNIIVRTRLRERPLATHTDNDAGPVLAIHIGGIGSADTVMKSGELRDITARRHRIIGFEMEGAGVWDELPSCLVVKGVCDYADSHKSKAWQRYAAATAASTAKALLRGYLGDGQLREQTGNLLSSALPADRGYVGCGNETESTMCKLRTASGSAVTVSSLVTAHPKTATPLSGLHRPSGHELWAFTEIGDIDVADVVESSMQTWMRSSAGNLVIWGDDTLGWLRLAIRQIALTLSQAGHAIIHMSFLNHSADTSAANTHLFCECLAACFGIEVPLHNTVEQCRQFLEDMEAAMDPDARITVVAEDLNCSSKISLTSENSFGAIVQLLLASVNFRTIWTSAEDLCLRCAGRLIPAENINGVVRACSRLKLDD